MSSTLRGILIGMVAIVLGLGLFAGGLILGRYGWGIMGYGPSSMMAAFVPNAYAQTDVGSAPCGYGATVAPVPGVGWGPGTMMGGGMMGGGMTLAPACSAGVGSVGASGLYGEEVKPFSLNEAEAAVEDYLAALGNDDLALSEVMIFNNHAYAEVIEESSGIGAFEVLVDPITQDIYPEPGPNMMWNTKYGHMSGFGMMGMMGNSGWPRRGGMGAGMISGVTAAEISAEMPVSPEEAIESAQRYLDRYLPGTQVQDEADTFYGYYTLHITRDGQTIGMLSVNGYTRTVFPHTWHGDFLEMSEDLHG
jgi:hypothetical protein